MAKRRLDQRLVEDGLAESRTRAQALVRAGLVHGTGCRFEKPGALVPDDVEVFVKGRDHPYVSRGGVKLAGALDAFALPVADMVCADFGASTGGFTDCLLQRGARRVYAFDVGRGQLHERLARDARVISREKTHVDEIDRSMVPEAIDLVVADLSFISLQRAFDPARRILRPGGHAVLLAKPQFELAPDRVGKGGIVRDEAHRREALAKLEALAAHSGFRVCATTPSPITGAGGNQEFFLFLENLAETAP